MHNDFEIRHRALKHRYHAVSSLRFLAFLLLFLNLAVVSAEGVKWMDAAATMPFRLILGFAVIVSILVFFRVKKTFQQTLIAADRRLLLKDRLSSANEVYTRQIKTAFSLALLDDAVAHIDQIGTKKVIPFERSGWFYLIPVLLLLNAFLVFEPLSLVKKSKTWEAIQQTGKPLSLARQIEDFKEKMLESDDPKGLTEKFKEIERTAKQMLAKNQASGREAMKSFSGLLETIEKKNQAEFKELKEQLDPGGNTDEQGMNIPSPVPTPPSTRKNEQVAVDLNDLKEKAEQGFDDDMPDHIERRLSNLETNMAFQKYLENLLKKYGREASEDEQTGSSGHNQDQQAAEAGSSGAGGAEKSSPDKKNESAQAGSQVPESRPKNQNPLVQNKGRIEQDKSGQFKKGSFGYAVKALPVINQSTLSTEQVMKNYIRSNEAVMLKENIPAEYKEGIKEYFLSIGLEGK